MEDDNTHCTSHNYFKVNVNFKIPPTAEPDESKVLFNFLLPR